MSRSGDSLTTKRRFSWGIVIIGDADTQQVPALDEGNAIAASDSAVVALVRHAQDVETPEDTEFLVEVQCIPGRAERDDNDVRFDGDILISSGRLSVGDADHEDTLIVEPGRWRLQISAEPIRHSERVTVWFSPAQANLGP